MEIKKTEGIVLSSKKINDADVISSIYTKKFGLHDFIFKGIKKSKHRSKTATEPGVEVNILFYYKENKNIFTANEFKVINYGFELYKNLDRIYHLSFILEIVKKTVGHNHTDLKIYNLLQSALIALNETENVSLLTAFFIIHLLKTEGIAFDTNNISKKNLDFIQLSYKKKFKEIESKNYDKNEMSELIYFFVNFIENYFFTNFKSKQFIFQSWKSFFYRQKKTKYYIILKHK